MGDNNKGFAIDVPITNLDDEDIDNFRMDDAEYDNENYSFDLDALGFADRQNPIVTGFQRIKSLFSRHGNNSGYLDDIELIDRNDSISSSAQFEDYSYHSRKHHRCQVPKKFILHFGLLIIISLLITIIVLFTTSAKKGDSLVAKPNGDHKVQKILLTNGTEDFYATTILISLDGFHPHYISEKNTPFMHKLLMGRGYAAPYMIPTDPSVTFTNHWTLVTGLKPIYHGIVGNEFFDTFYGETFNRANASIAMNPKWWGGEPIWTTARKQGLKVGTHMWPGSEVISSEGLGPDFVDAFNISEVLSKKVDRIFEWLDLGINERPELVLSYVPTIDTLGHKYGISGRELEEGLTYVDAFLEDLYLGLYERNLVELANVLIVSDHGMSPTSYDRLIYLDDLVNVDKIEHFDGWPLFGLRPFIEFELDIMYKDMKSEWEKHPMKNFFDVYSREEIMDTLFGGSDSEYSSRVAPIWVIPKIGYSITTRKHMNGKNSYTPKGVHGYDSNEVLMRSLFLSTGPYFSDRLDKFTLKPFENTEIYNIICDSLNIIPSPNNGTGLPSIINKNQLLDDSWKDVYSYPNVSFEVDVIDTASTYDLLWALPQISNNLKPGKQLDEEIDHEDATIGDDNHGNGDNDDNNDEDGNEEEDDDKEEEEKGEEKADDHDNDDEDDDNGDNDDNGNDENDNTNDNDGHGNNKDDGNDVKKGKSDKNKNKDPEHEYDAKKGEKPETQTEENNKNKEHKGKNMWNKIGKVFDDLMDDVEELVDDTIEDIHKLAEKKGKGKNGNDNGKKIEKIS